ncbi:heterokaryon incompatibility protein-domain-containing protein [Xylaria digitata]|nr:heterokaryon incompatibility protein-domain-containing protein [Xylaria digitata]
MEYKREASKERLRMPHYIYARAVAPQIDTRRVREWIACCKAEHHKCYETGFIAPAALENIRLIDVQKRQVVECDMGSKYIALSYVWGAGTKGLLTRSTVKKYAREGSLAQEDVPHTIRDAILLVADLGERYLWVDSLCIIQDDLPDKIRYLPMIGEIYDAAVVVIVAAVKNAHSGLPGRGGYERRQPRTTETIQGIDFTFGQPHLEDYLQTTVWNTRGWTYQEAQLARRTLVITDFQAYWSCQGGSWCEDRSLEFPNWPRTPLGYNSLFAKSVLPDHTFRQTGTLTNVTIELCSLGEYCQNVKEFSSRSFSYRGDVLWAFAGILKSLLSIFPQGYIWAMPKAKLHSALLWKTNNTHNLHDPLIILNEKGDWQKLTVPSWCWLAKGTEVWYDDCYESIESMVEWHEPVHSEKPGPPNDSQGEEEEEERGKTMRSMIFQSNQTFQGSTVFDFALLHFTAESTILRMHNLTFSGPHVYKCAMGSATLSLLSGEKIGSIDLPISTFSSKKEIRGEFILLSLTPVDSNNPRRNSVEPMYNIMFVRWSDDKKFAHRIAWTEITKSAWEKCETRRKTIILA